MSKEGTAFGGAVERLVLGGHTVEVLVQPGHGQNKSTVKAIAADGSVAAKFSGKDFGSLTTYLVEATRNTGDVTPSTNALSALEYMAKAGGKFRFVALDESGELVINPEFDTPIQHKQRAAARRNGLTHGAAAILDCVTGEIERISMAPIKNKAN